jgi:hypothetical protein
MFRGRWRVPKGDKSNVDPYCANYFHEALIKY